MCRVLYSVWITHALGETANVLVGLAGGGQGASTEAQAAATLLQLQFSSGTGRVLGSERP